MNNRVNGFSPESCQIFFGITACLSQVSVAQFLLCYLHNSSEFLCDWTYVVLVNHQCCLTKLHIQYDLTTVI